MNSNNLNIDSPIKHRRCARLENNFIFSQELTPPTIISATFNSHTNDIQAKKHEQNANGEVVDQVLKETIPEDILEDEEEEDEETQFYGDIQLSDQKDRFFVQTDSTFSFYPP